MAEAARLERPVAPESAGWVEVEALMAAEAVAGALVTSEVAVEVAAYLDLLLAQAVEAVPASHLALIPFNAGISGQRRIDHFDRRRCVCMRRS